MRITIFLFIVGFCLVSAKYLSFKETDSNELLRVKRSISDDSSNSNEENSSENDDDDDDDTEDGEIKRKEQEDKIIRKALERLEKEKRKKEEEKRKLEEKQAKMQRKEEEKREKEERKRIEKLEKEKRKEEEKRRKELEKLEKQASHIKPLENGLLEAEEENSVELSDIWKEHIYVKYGLTIASTKLEKQAALNRYIEEELGLSQNSTERERYQAVIQLLQNKMQADAAARTALKNQLLSHINAVSIQKLRADLDKDIEKLNNKSELLNNVMLPWAPLAKQEIEERRSFLQTISQFLSSILPNWLTGGQNVQKPNPSSVNRPLTGVSNNVAAGSNVGTVISDVSPAISQANIVVSIGGSDMSSSVNSSPAAGSSPDQETVNETVNGGNKNEITKPSSTLGGSEDSNSDSTSGNDDRDLASSTNTNGLTEGSIATVNINNTVESTNTVDNASPVDISVVYPDNSDSGSSSGTNNEISTNPNAAVIPSLSSTNANNDEAISTSISVEVPLINPDVINTGNDDKNVEDSSSSYNFNKGPSSDNKHFSSGASDSSVSPVKPDSVSDIHADVSTVNVPVISDGDSPVNNVAVSINSDNPSLNLAGNIVPLSTSTPENVLTSINTANEVKPGTTDTGFDFTSGSFGDNGATSVNEIDVSSTSNTNIDPAVISDAAYSDNSDKAATDTVNKPTSNVADDVVPQITGTQENVVTSDSNTDEVLPVITENNVDISIDVFSVGANEATSVNNAIIPSTGNDDNAPVIIPDSVSSGNSDIAAADNDSKPTSSAADEIVPQSTGTQENVVTSDSTTDVILPGISENNLDISVGVILSGGNEVTSINATNVPSTSNNDTAPAPTSDAASSVNSEIGATQSTDTEENVVTSDSTTDEVSPVITENNVDTSVGVISSGDNEVTSVNNANIASTSNNDNVPTIIPDSVISTGTQENVVTSDSTTDVISSEITKNNVESSIGVTDVKPITNVADDVLSQSIGTQEKVVTSDSIADEVSPVIAENNVDTSIGVISSSGNEVVSENNANVPSTGNSDNAPAIVPDSVPSGNSDISAADNGSKLTLSAGDDIVPQSTGTQENEVTSDSNPDVVSPGITENNVGTSIGVILSGGNKATSVKATSLPSTSNSVTEPFTPSAAVSINSDIAAVDSSVTLVSNVVNDNIPQSTSTPENEVTSDSTTNVVISGIPESSVDISIDVISTGSNVATSANDAKVTPTSNTDSVNSAANSDATTTDTGAQPISNLGDSTVASDSSVILSEGNTATADNGANILTSSGNDTPLNAEHPDVVSFNVSGDASVVTGNGLSEKHNTIPIGSSDTTLSIQISNVLPPNSSVVYADGNEVATDNIINSASTSETDLTLDASVMSDKGIEMPLGGVDAVVTIVTESSSSSVDSSPNNSGVPTNNDEIVSSSVVDKILPAITNQLTSEGTEAVTSIDDVSSNGVENSGAAPVNADSTDAIPNESISQVSEIKSSTSGNNNIVSNPEIPPAVDLAASSSDPNANNIDTTISPEIINAVQTQDSTTVAQSLDIVTESPVDFSNANEAGTTVREIINENTVLNTVAEAFAPQIPTSESSLVDTVSPVELPTSVQIKGIIIPN